ncbi:MAG: beta-ketoacyl-ACP synthase II [Rickettsiales bacterium]|jgi:3-oxoacyl-[acyl-carrier-protein] synthase II|nr:beta-ketoacyl-ACP synthase II [Rickettsiales bacterium]
MYNLSRRVVITGMGIISPLGFGLVKNWEEGLLKSRSGIGLIPPEYFDASDFPVKIAGVVPADDFRPEGVVPAKDLKKMDRFIQYALVAAAGAWEDSGIELATDEERFRAGVMVGSGIGGLSTVYDTSCKMEASGDRSRVSPFFIPASLINLASGHISIKYGLKGPNHACVTACATGTHAIGDAARMIALGDADIMVAGGAEAAINPAGVAGFASARTLSSRNAEPQRASRPWDKGRDGFVMGEGAGIVVLEEYSRARKRGARIYAEVAGYGASGDAYHITAPASDGLGAERAMRLALGNAGVEASAVDYVNAHGTSTPLGDMLEFGAISRVFADSLDRVSISSTKSAVGHLLGAAGAVEAIYSALAIRDNVAPPTLNLDDPEDDVAGVDLVPFKARARDIDIALSNSFGFGGTNACIVLRRAEDL